jgi:UDP-2,3-diacylglucosamine pyrophosphatase LpxH
MRHVHFLPIAALVAIAFSGCDWSPANTPMAPSPADSAASLIVASDLHYFSPGLMTDTASTDFKTYLLSDRKMIVQSPALLHSFLDSVRSRKPRIVLLTGDLTKDGEKQSHQEMADSLATLRKLGIQVYVIPGNHDVMNPQSQGYSGNTATSVPNVTDAQFASIYHDCGFDQAIARDSASLSYVVEPVPGLWLFAMDPTRWKDNTVGGTETVGGRFLPSTVVWIKAQLALAKSKGKTPVGAMHHGILEHFAGQASNPLSSDYVVAGYDTLGPIFAAGGLHVMFTGHFHANDIASKALSAGSLTDIETGSLVTSPSPFRFGSISANRGVTVSTSHIREIVGMTTGFQAWSNTFLLDGMTQLIEPTLLAQGVPATYAPMIAQVGAKAYAAHYAGDETGVPTDAQTQTVMATLASFGSAGAGLAATITTLYTDLAPADSAGTFSLLH